MADWTDGAQYAPVERPAAFAMPVAEPLLETPAPANPAAGCPAQPPVQYRDPASAIALRELVPATGPVRDPAEPFPAEGETVGAWGSAHAHRDPRLPLVDVTTDVDVSASARANFPPPSGAPVVPAPELQVVPGELPPPTGVPVAFPPPASWTGAAVLPPPAGAQYPATQYPVTQYPAAPVDPYTARPPQGIAPVQGTQYPAPVPQQQPGGLAPWQAPGQPSPVDTPGTGVGALVTGLGPVMLGSLLFGVFVPFFSVIAFIVASFLASRARLGVQAIRNGFSVCSMIFLVDWLAGYAYPQVPSTSATCQILCGAMLVISLVAGYRDLPRSRP